MNEIIIENASYVAFREENVSIKATIDGVEIFIPLDPANRHYAAILKAVEDGELTIAPAES